MSILAFSTPGLESAFVLRRNAQLLRNDAAWALFWFMFAAAGMGKAALLPWDRQTLRELAAIGAYMAWSPLLLWLIKRRTDFYLRRRSAVLVAMRIVRSLLLMHQLDRRETLWVGTADSPPATAFKVYVHLCHKVNFLLLTSVGVLLPLRLHLPLHLAFLLLTLRASAQRCRAECGLAHAAGHGPGAPLAFQPYYAAVVRWLRRLSPRMPWQLASRWTPPSGPADSCLGPCFAVHAFLQAVVGVLFPLALLWVWEERLRARELRSWRRALAQQQQHNVEQQQQQQQEPEPQEAAGSGEGPQQQQQQQLRRRRRQQEEGGFSPQGGSPQGSPLTEGGPSPQGSPATWRGSPPPLPQDLPLPLASTTLWFLVSTCLLWQLMEATLL